MKKSINLLEGSIFPSLTKLAFPIMATSLVQMAYNMTDMIWIGKISSGAVAAVGAAGMYMWLSNGLAILAKMGGQVKVAHAIGAGDHKEAVSYAQNTLQLGILFALVYGLICVVFTKPLIGFFNLNSPKVISDAEIYLKITCGVVIFSFLNQILTGIMTAMGNSKTPFFSTTIGLVFNIILDPVLIFGIGPFPVMGVTGAAVATVFSQMIVTIVFLVALSTDTMIFNDIRILSRPDSSSMKEIIQIGFPTGIQNMLFTAISMVVARLIARFGDNAIAVQKVGSQIEAISWMTADGFASAVNSFVAQNFGAKNIKRVKKGYKIAMRVMVMWGICCTAVLIFFPEPIFRIFIHEPEVLSMGVAYLTILGFSQLFMCIEITSAGTFSGIGKTVPPSFVGVSFNAARIPMAMILTLPVFGLGLNGVWWSITISSILKGVVLFTWLKIYMKKHLKES